MVAIRFLKLGIALTMAGASASTLASEADPVILAPAENWVLEMADDKCRIGRIFGEGDQRTAFYLEQWSPSETVSWAVAGPPIKEYRPGQMSSYSFGPGGDSGEIQSDHMTFGVFGNQISGMTSVVARLVKPDEGPPVAAPYGLPRLDDKRAAGVTRFSISQKGRPDVALDLGDLELPLTVMNRCMEDLVEHWGLDPEEQRQVHTPAKLTGLETVARALQRDYPRKAESKGAQAIFFVRLNIGIDGSIEECRLVNKTLAADFDMTQLPCKLFKRFAKIEPARDAQGKALKSWLTTQIVYSITSR